jgi:hypothetical protein
MMMTTVAEDLVTVMMTAVEDSDVDATMMTAADHAAVSMTMTTTDAEASATVTMMTTAGNSAQPSLMPSAVVKKTARIRDIGTASSSPRKSFAIVNRHLEPRKNVPSFMADAMRGNART